MARNRYDMDEILEDSFDVNQLKRLAGYIAPYKKKMAGVILLMLSSSALTMAIPIFFQNVMDHSIPEKDMKSITFYSIATLLIALYSGISLRIKIKTMSVIGRISYMTSAMIFSVICRNFHFPIMMTDHMEKFRCVWSIM